MELDIGGIPRQANLRPLPERTFNNSLVFDYTVERGDTDSDGVGIDANRLTLYAGGIHDMAGNAVGTSHPALTANPVHKVATPDER